MPIRGHVMAHKPPRLPSLPSLPLCLHAHWQDTQGPEPAGSLGKEEAPQAGILNTANQHIFEVHAHLATEWLGMGGRTSQMAFAL